MKNKAMLWRFTAQYAWPHRWASHAGAACLLATNWLTVTIPIVLGEGIDALTAGGTVGEAVTQIALMGLVVIVVRTLSRVLFFNPGRDMEYRPSRRDMFSHLLSPAARLLRGEPHGRHRQSSEQRHHVDPCNGRLRPRCRWSTRRLRCP